MRNLSTVRVGRVIFAAIELLLSELRDRVSPPTVPCTAIFEPLESRRLLSVNVTTYHYDNARDGANTAETTLTTSNVKTSTFGKLDSFPVDGQIYGQPLVMTNIAMANGEGTHDIGLVATENDSVYAFDVHGNNPTQGYLWKVSLLKSGETPVPEADYGSTDITPIIGITSTPVINTATNTIYVVGMFKESNGTYSERIYALNISSGANNISPVTLAASVAGTGAASVNGIVTYNPFRQNQRPALTLANGEVYVASASHGDENPWHGWILAYNASSLHLDYTYCNTPNGTAGGIWMSGGGLAVDSSGNLYFTTGNGTFDANTGGSDYGMTIQKLSPSLSVEDYFAPYNQSSLSNSDLDYGCSSVIVLSNQTGPDPNEILTESKWGTMYLNNSNTGSLGEFTTNGPNDDLGEANITTNTFGSNLHNAISYWNGTAYVAGDALPLEAFAVGNSTLGTTPTSESSKVFGSRSVEDGQGAGVTISSNGTSNGIVWALDNSGFNSQPAVLYAYNANNLSQLLWSSNQAANGRDTASNAVKFQTPVVANGLVYVAGAGSLTVYGLLPPAIGSTATASPSPVTGTTTTLTALAADPGTDAAPTYTWAAITVPNGATAPTFNPTGTNASNSSTATFSQAGNYTFQVTITDPTSGVSVTSNVTVMVNQTLSGITAAPNGSLISNNVTQQFTASGVDQFGNTLSAQPAFAWSIVGDGVGSISSTGLYQAPANGGGAIVIQATSGSITAQAGIDVGSPSWLGTTSGATWNSFTQVLNVTGPITIAADPGTDEPVIQANSSSAVITIDPVGDLIIHLGGLSLTDGASAIVTSPGTTSRGVIVVGNSTAPLLTIDSSSKLDLTNNDMDIVGGSLAVVTIAVAQQFNSGTGIISSTAVADSTHESVLGVIQNNASGTALFNSSNPFDGTTPGASDILVQNTVYGDANLDGSVNASDYALINAAYNLHNGATGWYNGDFNYDGTIDGSDYSLIDNIYLGVGTTPTAQLVKASAAAIPINTQWNKPLTTFVSDPIPVVDSLIIQPIPQKHFDKTSPMAATPDVQNPTNTTAITPNKPKSSSGIFVTVFPGLSVELYQESSQLI